VTSIVQGGVTCFVDSFHFRVVLYDTYLEQVKSCVIGYTFKRYKVFFLHLRQHEAASLNILVNYSHALVIFHVYC